MPQIKPKKTGLSFQRRNRPGLHLTNEQRSVEQMAALLLPALVACSALECEAETLLRTILRIMSVQISAVRALRAFPISVAASIGSRKRDSRSQLPNYI